MRLQDTADRGLLNVETTRSKTSVSRTQPFRFPPLVRCQSLSSSFSEIVTLVLSCLKRRAYQHSGDVSLCLSDGRAVCSANNTIPRVPALITFRFDTRLVALEHSGVV